MDDHHQPRKELPVKRPKMISILKKTNASIRPDGGPDSTVVRTEDVEAETQHHTTSSPLSAIGGFLEGNSLNTNAMLIQPQHWRQTAGSRRFLTRRRN